MDDIAVKHIANSESSWTFIDGSRRAAQRLLTAYVGEGVYQPGWRWSEHIGSQTGQASQHHIGYVLSGFMVVQSKSGIERRVGPGDAFELTAEHDAWVEGDKPCVALDFGMLV